MQDNFTTQRLILNLLRTEDSDFINQLVNTPGWINNIGNRNINNSEDATAYIQRILHNPDIRYWVVKLKSDDVPVGIITFIKREMLEHPDLGFAFLPQYEGKGYAFEASKEVLDTLAGARQYKRILATTIPSNSRSIHLLHRLGFKFDYDSNDGDEILKVYAFECAV
jgi:RimJ/RimL family protein N-acetyltransferase